MLLPSFFVSRFLHFGRFLKLFSSGKKIILRPRKKSRPSDRFSHVVVSRMTEASCSIRPPWNSGSSAERGMAASRPRPAREVPTGTNKPGQKITGISSVRLPSPCSASGQKIFPKRECCACPARVPCVAWWRARAACPAIAGSLPRDPALLAPRVGSGGCMRGCKPGPTSSRELGRISLVASARCLPRDRGQLASQAWAVCRTTACCMPRASLGCILARERALLTACRARASCACSSRVGEACHARPWVASRAAPSRWLRGMVPRDGAAR